MTHYTRRTQNKSTQSRQPQRRAPQRDNGQRKPTGNLKEQYNKYVNMAKEARASGDHIQSEYYYQHAEHYGRMLAERLAQAPKPRETMPPQEAPKTASPSVSVPINAPAEPTEVVPTEEPKEKKPVRRTVRKKVAEPKEEKVPAAATENSSLT